VEGDGRVQDPNETPTGAMLEKTATHLFDLAASGPMAGEGAISGAKVVAFLEQLARSGFAFGICRKPGQKPTCVGLIVRGGAKADSCAIIDMLIDAAGIRAKQVKSVQRRDGRVLTAVADANGQGYAMWNEGDDLAFSLVSPQAADVMIAAVSGQRPNAIAHPVRQELARINDGFVPAGLAFFAMSALPPVSKEAKALGLDGVKQIDVRWGYQGDALMSILRVHAPAPRQGMLALLDQPALDAQALPPCPPSSARGRSSRSSPTDCSTSSSQSPRPATPRVNRCSTR
jgi:hypothetical protein